MKKYIFHFYCILPESSNDSLSAVDEAFLAQIRSHACKMGFKIRRFRKKTENFPTLDDVTMTSLVMFKNYFTKPKS